MKRSLLLLMVLALAGCVGPMPETELEQATSNIDAVEGEQADSEGLAGEISIRDDAVQGDPAWAPVHPQPQPEHYTTATGSLFSPVLAQNLYDDTRPRRIGDIVTVLLQEKTQASKSASAGLDKSIDLSMDPIQMGGQEVMVGNYNLSYEIANENQFTGSATADQSNSLTGELSVEVIDILANGNLIVRGEKWLTLNNGDEYIRVSGTIRPDDISTENTIPSTRISNAKIQYSATGERQDTQEAGRMTRFFNAAM